MFDFHYLKYQTKAKGNQKEYGGCGEKQSEGWRLWLLTFGASN
jgi:hypothetical protein